MPLSLDLVNDRALGGHSIQPNFERIAEAGTISARIVPVASRARNELIKIQSHDEANKIAGG